MMDRFTIGVLIICAILVAGLLAMFVDMVWFTFFKSADIRDIWPPATGEDLDRIAEVYGLRRWRWWFFRERDTKLRHRIHAALNGREPRWP